AMLPGREVQRRVHLTEAARAVRRRRAHGPAPTKRGARPHPRRAQRRRHAAGGGRGDFSDGHLRWDARRGRRAGDLRTGARRARRAVSRGGAGAVSRAALDAAVEAARAAGAVGVRYYRGGFEVTIKPDATPVTQADRHAERVSVEIL